MKTLARTVIVSLGAASALLACRDRNAPAMDAPEASAPAWQLLASELPSALLSVSGRSASDIYAVGADKGHGPLVLHFDGKVWKELATGQSADLWWVQAIPGGPVLMGGASATVLRYDGAKFQRLPTPGLGRQTVYGVWGTSGDDFYAVGSAGGRNGFVWHYHAGAFEKELLPLDLPRVAGGEIPGFFKVWGTGDEVWVVGAAGSVMHRKGAAPFTVVPTTVKDTIFTVHGVGDRLLAVGGAGNGVLLAGSKGTFRDASPQGAGLLQGVFAGEKGDWATGERGLVFTREKPDTAFAAIDHGLTLPPTSSLHSVFVDASGGVWSAGGNVLTPALDGGMLIHYGAPVPTVVIAEDEKPTATAKEAPKEAGAAPVTCPAAVVAAGKNGSIARRWDEQILAAIRLDLPRPTVHARNLFHLSAAMWDAWSAYDTKAAGVFVSERHTATSVDGARQSAISYAAYDVLAHRYEAAVGHATTLACLRAVMVAPA